MTDGFFPRKVMSESICECQLMGEIGQRTLSISVFCKSNPCMPPPPLLWLCSQIMNISWRASDTMPRKIFQGFFFFSDRNPGVRECHRGVKSVCGPEAKDRIYDAVVDVIRWIFSFQTGELLCPPPLINLWAALGVLSLLKRSVLSVAFIWVEKWFQSTQSASCVLTNCDRFLRLISAEREWQSSGGLLGGTLS